MASALDRLRDELTSDPLSAVRSLLGSHVVMGDCRAEIVESEVYLGAEDPGSHAFRGKSPRNAVMFGPAGHAYIYFTYGNHWMLNVVGRPDGEPAAILIRAARPLTGIELMRQRRGGHLSDRDLLSGPGKLCQALGIDAAFNGHDLLSSGALRIEVSSPTKDVLIGPRIGLAKGKGDDLPWRFVMASQRAWCSGRQKELRPLRDCAEVRITQ
jgi:DNA-3-methyladenine glycosylase